MNCVLCKIGLMRPGLTTVILTRGESAIVYKKVPATVCDDCGEYFLDEATATDIYERAEQAFAAGQELSISNFHVA